MYSEADRAQVRAQLRKRWLISVFPSGLMVIIAIVVFALCQARRQDWGWIFASAMTIAGGTYFLLLYGVYLRPMWLYARHVGYMLEGRKRETTGILAEVAEEPVDKDGLDWYALIVNVGERADPEDDRLLYYDALKGKPQVPLGTRVTVLSNDKMIAEIREA